MDRIFVTGDCHGVLSRIYNWVERFDMNKDNVHIIIAGDADNEDVSFISGCSPVIFEALMRGKSSKDLMLEKLNSERYANVK